MSISKRFTTAAVAVSLIAGSLAAALVTGSPSNSARGLQTERSAAPRESRIPVGKVSTAH